MDYGNALALLRPFYDRTAVERDRSEKTPWKVAERAHFLAMLQQYHAATVTAPNARIRLLEIGAGTGQDGLFFQDAGLDVVCTDASSGMVEQCRAKGLAAHGMDFLHLDLPPESFDAIFALNCLLHVPRRALPDVLASLRVLLRPGGHCYVGIYGGADQEGDLAGDGRFFSSHSNTAIIAAVAPYFDLLYFRAIRLGASGRPDRHCFQSLILQRPPEEC
jgi:SAM-dependent methyltransferase